MAKIDEDRQGQGPAQPTNEADDRSPMGMKDEFIYLMRRMMRQRPYPPEVVRELPIAEARVLLIVFAADRTGETVRPSDIARKTHRTPSAASQILKSLEERGYIERRRAAGDSRSVIVALTESGAQLSRSMERTRDEFFSQMIAAVGVDNMRQYLDTLEKICEFCETSDAFGTVSMGPCGAGPAPSGAWERAAPIRFSMARKGRCRSGRRAGRAPALLRLSSTSRGGASPCASSAI